MRFFHKKAPLTGKTRLAEDTFRFELEAPGISRAARPGQFIHVEAPGRSLRRAFSIAGASGSSVSIIFRVRGTGTSAISRFEKGDRLDVIGPLGNGFPESPGKPLFVAGGLGAAPLAFLASTSSGGTFIYGARKQCEFIPDGLLGASGHTLIKVCQELTGRLVTDLAEESISPDSTVYAAGPVSMLKKLADICRGKAKTFVSWEENLGCGTGLCQGCPVRTLSGYRMTCSDGPVFDAEEIDWDAC